MEDKKVGHVVFSDSDPAIKEDDITAIENHYNIRLPLDYKKFLVAINGGSPTPSGFCSLDESPGQLGSRNGALIKLLEAELAICTKPARIRELEEDIRFLKNSYVPQRVDRIFGLHSIPPTLQWRLQLMADSSVDWTLRLLPIGFDMDSTPILMSLNQNDAGAIYCLALDGSESSEGSELKKFCIGLSFIDFIRRLFPAKVLHAPGMALMPRHRSILRLDEYNE